MQLIKLNATDSTQQFLKNYITEQTQPLPNTVVWALQQNKGVGQYGTKWLTEPGKNLTFSFLYNIKYLHSENYFLLNMLVALAIVQVLEALSVPDLKIKWPNDILSSNKKIGGVLIENSIRHSQICRTVIGVGLNVNQKEFENLPKASSLVQIMKQEFDLETLLHQLILSLTQQLARIEGGTFSEIYPEYRHYLYRIDKVSTFRPHQGADFSAIIREVTHSGMLQLELEDERLHYFTLKELQLLY